MTRLIYAKQKCAKSVTELEIYEDRSHCTRRAGLGRRGGFRIGVAEKSHRAPTSQR
jgi:hypothetical protein